MSEVIVREAHFFVSCLVTGVIVVALYDIIRIIRRVISHSNAVIAAEDLIFWFLGGIYIFRMLYIKNDGIIRGFAIIAIVTGMIVYNITISSLIVKYVSLVLNKIVDVLTFPVKFVMRIFLKTLKKCIKTVKIKLSKHEKERG